MSKPTKDTLTTKDGIRVAVGQVWVDMDKRQQGLRKVQVCEIDADAGRVKVVRIDTFRNPTWVSVRRMHKHSSGWELVAK